VLRRMQITQFDGLARYIDRLRGDSDEVNALFVDLLIGVTHFFRDSEAFSQRSKRWSFRGCFRMAGYPTR
jgi:two-component system CheB/CheR fusion protein